MRAITKYISYDGKEFETEEACLMYETAANNIIYFVKSIRQYCSSTECDKCKLYFHDSIHKCMFRDTPSCWHIPGEDNNTTHKADCSTEAPTYRGMPEYDD